MQGGFWCRRKLAFSSCLRILGTQSPHDKSQNRCAGFECQGLASDLKLLKAECDLQQVDLNTHPPPLHSLFGRQRVTDHLYLLRPSTLLLLHSFCAFSYHLEVVPFVLLPPPTQGTILTLTLIVYPFTSRLIRCYQGQQCHGRCFHPSW